MAELEVKPLANSGGDKEYNAIQTPQENAVLIPQYDPDQSQDSPTSVRSMSDFNVDSPRTEAERKAELRRLAKATLTDRLGFCVGVGDLVITAFFIGRWPENFWILHIAKAVVLLSWRFTRFRQTGCEWYLMDFCYFVEYLAVIFCGLAWLRVEYGLETPLFQWNAEIVRAGFAVSSGPLAWSVLIFRNSIVFHDIDHMTSVFIHVSPPLLFWCIRWGAGMGPMVVQKRWPNMFVVCPDGDMADVDQCASLLVPWCHACPADWNSFTYWPLGFWAGWALIYVLVVFVIFKRHIQTAGKETLYDHVARSKPQKEFLEVFPDYPGVRKAAYMFLHLLSLITFGALGAVFWHSFVAHTLFLLGMLGWATKNGAGYFFKVFAHKYWDNLRRRQEAKEERQRRKQEAKGA
eukprot:TRINITY_DN26521_c0_g1_i1.p1 TRINITY_DN26521_c0_g1~~TRINITY_DN26521_c0_g1_i1.p1  ORF type:complete len:428 (+),score=123.25 TRINITY_DN26521_c0_g1_i1:72-1286(+)